MGTISETNLVIQVFKMKRKFEKKKQKKKTQKSNYYCRPLYNKWIT